MSLPKKFVYLIICWGCLFLLSSPFNPAQGENSIYNISATVKISICGDGAKENPEACDNLDLNSQTCTSLGYAGGKLSCDLACDFDTSNCTAASVAPSPAATVIPSSPSPTTVLPSPIPTLLNAVQNLLTPLTSLLFPAATPPVSTPPPLSQILASFLTEAGRIEKKDLVTVVKTWVDNWRASITNQIAVLQGQTQAQTLVQEKEQYCDLNIDGTCNLIDFSILLSYIE